MGEKPLSDLGAMDRLAEYRGMPRPHGFGGTLSHYGDPANVMLGLPGRMIYPRRHPEGIHREPVFLGPTRTVKAKDWLRSLL